MTEVSCVPACCHQRPPRRKHDLGCPPEPPGVTTDSWAWSAHPCHPMLLQGRGWASVSEPPQAIRWVLTAAWSPGLPTAVNHPRPGGSP